MKHFKTIAMIPARAGSKGLAAKNTRMFLGKPLLAWTIEQAKRAALVDLVVVSTDAPEIAEIAIEYGADVPVLRPANISGDNSPTIDAVLHMLEVYEERDKTFDNLVLLEPTSPLRRDDDIDRALHMFEESYDKYESLVSLGLVQLENPSLMQTVENECVRSLLGGAKPLRRQDCADAFFPYGVIYGAKTSILREKRSFYTDRTLPFFVERWQNFEIDDLCSFLVCEQIMKSRLEGLL